MTCKCYKATTSTQLLRCSVHDTSICDCIHLYIGCRACTTTTIAADIAFSAIAFNAVVINALTLLFGRHEVHLAHKKYGGMVKVGTG